MLTDGAGPIDSAPLKLVDLPVPQPGPGQVRVRVNHCGVCLTDLHVVEVGRPSRGPIAPRHQVIGKVGAGGSGAERFRHGDRVGVAWLWQTCRACRPCATGRALLARQGRGPPGRP